MTILIKQQLNKVKLNFKTSASLRPWRLCYICFVARGHCISQRFVPGFVCTIGARLKQSSAAEVRLVFVKSERGVVREWRKAWQMFCA